MNGKNGSKPPPERVVRGSGGVRLSQLTGATSQAPDWAYWTELAEVRVFEAIALLEGEEPGKAPPPDDEADERYLRRLRLLTTAMSDRQQFTPGALNMANRALSTVRLADVGRWASRSGLHVPARFPRAPQVAAANEKPEQRIHVALSHPYLSLDLVAAEMGYWVPLGTKNSIPSLEEQEAEKATWGQKLRELAQKGAIKGHDFDTLQEHDWSELKIERDVVFFEDLNACAELKAEGLSFTVLNADFDPTSHTSLTEIFVNDRSIDWRYWIDQMPSLSAGEAARLMVGMDPDVYADINATLSGLCNAPSELRQAAVNIERLAAAERIERQSPHDWLTWAQERGFNLHHAFSYAVNRRQEREEANERLRLLPEQVAAMWHRAHEVQKDVRHIETHFAGLRSSFHSTLPQFIEQATERLQRWKDGVYLIVEAAQVMADANSGVDAIELCHQMETAIHDGKLTLRRNGIPLGRLAIPSGRLWNRFIFADDVNEWLRSCRAPYQLAYPYTATEPKQAERRVSDEDWKELARERAKAYIKEQKARDLFPSQENIADHVARGFRAEGIVGADGKPLTGATIKRHALKGISSAVAKQLSTAPSRGK